MRWLNKEHMREFSEQTVCILVKHYISQILPIETGGSGPGKRCEVSPETDRGGGAWARPQDAGSRWLPGLVGTRAGVTAPSEVRFCALTCVCCVPSLMLDLTEVEKERLLDEVSPLRAWCRAVCVD